MIAPTPFFSDRGCHTQIYEEIKALQKLGHEIVLCTYGLGRDIEGITTVRCYNPPWYRKLSAGPSYTKIMLLPILTWAALREISRFKPDIVHAHLHEGAVIARVCKIFYPKLQFLFDMQGSLAEECIQHGFFARGSRVHRFFVAVETRIANWFPVITQSDTMVTELQRMSVPAERIANVKDGVDTDTFRPMPPDEGLARELGISLDKPRVLYMGLMETYQGVDLLFEAFKTVSERVPQAQFIIIGYPNIDRYRKLAEELGVAHQTFFLGRIDYAKLPRYLSLAEVAVAPKIAATEGDGKIYNYMAMGLPTVAFSRSVSREILGDAGILAEMRNARDLGEKIIWALENHEVVRRLGEKARERAVQNLSWDAVGRRIDLRYSALAEEL